MDRKSHVLRQGRIVTLPGVRSAGAAIAAFAIAACNPLDGPETCALPQVESSRIVPIPGNVIGATVITRVHDAATVAVRLTRATGASENTASVDVQQADVEIPVLGLHESSSYAMSVEATNECGTASGDILSHSTGALPTDLPRYQASGPDPSPGYVAFAAGNYGIVIDNSGRTVWYHRFPNGPGLNFQAQRNGRYLARPAPQSGQAARWTEIDPLGNVTRTLGCAHGMSARMHDILVEADGSWWLMCDEIRTPDLSSQGIPSNTPVMGTAVQHFSAAGNLLFEWSPFDHMDIDISGLDPADRAGAFVNWTHGNSFDIDTDGNLLISYRNLDEIVKVDSRTGALVWRMGGTRSQFAMDPPLQPFRRQHSVRATARGEIALLDNLGHSGPSRMERYQFDESARTAKLIVSHASSAGVVALTGGTVQQISGSRTLVSFGSGGNVEEVDSAGNVVWKLDGNPGYVFRAQRIRSLARPGAMGEAR